MIGELLYYSFIIVGLVLMLFVFNKKYSKTIRYLFFIVSVLLFYVTLGVPFVVASPIRSFLCIGFGSNAENIITHEIRFFGGCDIPLGWKAVEPKSLTE